MSMREQMNNATKALVYGVSAVIVGVIVYGILRRLPFIFIFGSVASCIAVAVWNWWRNPDTFQ